MVVRAAGEPGLVRVGLVAGRKVGSAVERNRARRRIRHAVRQVMLTPGTDYVVVASAEVNRVPFSTLVGWLSAAANEER